MTQHKMEFFFLNNKQTKCFKHKAPLETEPNVSQHISNVDGSLILVAVHEDLVVDKETSESELIESVKGFPCVAVEVERVRCGAANFVGIDGVKVRCVGGMFDFGNIWRFLLSQIGLEVDTLEERVHFHFIRIFAQSTFGRRAKAEDKIGCFSRQI